MSSVKFMPFFPKLFQASAESSARSIPGSKSLCRLRLFSGGRFTKEDVKLHLIPVREMKSGDFY